MDAFLSLPFSFPQSIRHSTGPHRQGTGFASTESRPNVQLRKWSRSSRAPETRPWLVTSGECHTTAFWPLKEDGSPKAGNKSLLGGLLAAFVQLTGIGESAFVRMPARLHPSKLPLCMSTSSTSHIIPQLEQDQCCMLHPIISLFLLFLLFLRVLVLLLCLILFYTLI